MIFGCELVALGKLLLKFHKKIRRYEMKNKNFCVLMLNVKIAKGGGGRQY
jgi:hypothetical protein